MKREAIVLSLFLLLIMPVYASAQNPERISIIDNFGDFDKGEPLFIYGQVATLLDDSFLIMQIINPVGDLCQIKPHILPFSGIGSVMKAPLGNGTSC